MNKKVPCSSNNSNNSNIKNGFIDDDTAFMVAYDNRLVKSVCPDKLSTIPKPIIKWVGGKTQILDKLLLEFPVEINNYREIFLGGGSVLFALLWYVKQGIIKVNGNIYAYDLNEALIHMYINIQTSPDDLYGVVQGLINEFNDCSDEPWNKTLDNELFANTRGSEGGGSEGGGVVMMICKEKYYYRVRAQYNMLPADDKNGLIGSAMFIFLNKTCFRGLYRAGPNGFNVPYGHYKNPEIINKDHLSEIHDLIQGVVFECCDFKTSLNNTCANDFIYLDPPYAPETDTSFVGYTENGFHLESHMDLFKRIHEGSEHSLSEHGLIKNHKKILMSNADVKLVRDNFSSERYNITSILCKRTIHSKKPESKAKEVIIRNY
jgi:DNA adenine methylase